MNNKKLKICIVVPAHWEALIGGAEYQANLLTNYLVETGRYDIYYLARRVNKSFKPVGYKIIQIAKPEGIRRFGEFFDTLNLIKILKEISPDVIYQRVGCGYTGITAYYARKHKIRCVWHVAHDREVMPFDWSLTKNIMFRYVDKKFLEYGVKNVHAIITQTQQQADYLFDNYARKNDALIPNAHPEPEGKIVKNPPIKIVWVANIKAWKRPEILLKLAKDLEYLPDVEFIMIGKITGSKEWSNHILEKINQPENLKFLGEQPQNIVNETLSKSHIFINTSEQEGFANTFIQSWYRKIPVLTLSVNPDGVFNDEKLGICSVNYESLKNNLLKLIKDERVREEMGIYAQNYAIDKYSIRNFEKILEILFKK